MGLAGEIYGGAKVEIGREVEVSSGGVELEMKDESEGDVEVAWHRGS